MGAPGDPARGLGKALLLGGDHDDELAPPRQQVLQLAQVRIGHRSRRRTHRLGDMRDDPRVDRVGLGQLPERLGEAANLPRV